MMLSENSIAKPFDLSYLAGVNFHRSFSYGLECERQVEERVKAYISKDFAPAVADLERSCGDAALMDLSLTEKTTRREYAVAPVFFKNVEWEGETYRFLVNGATGKVAGGVPLDRNRCARQSVRKVWKSASGFILLLLGAIALQAVSTFVLK